MIIDPEPPRTLLVLMAHPDDLEYSAAGTVARWAQAGTSVVLCLCTHGERGTPGRAADLSNIARIRGAEARAAASILGCADVCLLSRPDGAVAADGHLERALVRQIRLHRPEALMCPDPTWRFDSGYINHPDHIAVGEAALRAADPGARNWHVFPELEVEGLSPHEVQRVFLASPRHENCVVDITGTLQTKIAALRAHLSQTTDVAVADILTREAVAVGTRHGLAHAEAFYLITLV
jgi:LmbE family N-acetylglucosaminyl deacetylase